MNSILTPRSFKIKLQNEVPEEMINVHQRNPQSTVSYRRCTPNLFDIVLSGGFDRNNKSFKVRNSVIKINGKNLKNVKDSFE